MYKLYNGWVQMPICVHCKYIDDDESSLFCQNCGNSFSKINHQFNTSNNYTSFSRVNKFKKSFWESISLKSIIGVNVFLLILFFVFYQYAEYMCGVLLILILISFLFSQIIISKYHQFNFDTKSNQEKDNDRIYRAALIISSLYYSGK